ncbi:PREDICTED: WPP domain-interacting protein 3-like [Camelina sativa]|uniref:WPP domain-interacting protein 3-like n=1 Tax=Camelina sativa TaxID=90675 RepID=A0ABM1QZL3_CAMSA|nr:PREDICTED: WPP domain-interacting protein 3-like [Camelina sativa]XP_019092201.1 PREDICTED: WPP domain-interacting protein 3-like [Camelina sativa]
MNDSVPESVEEDNGNSVLADHTPNGSVGSPPRRSNSVDSSIRVESPGGSATRKGFGLKKWRRIKRDGPVKDDDAATPVDDGSSKLLKRNLTGLVNPPSKHVDLSSVEARQSSEGSVGSVNMVHHPGVVNGFIPPDPGCIFTVGQASEKSEEHSGNAIGVKVVSGSQGRIWSGGTVKKASEEPVDIEKEKPCSSMDSDLRSSDFVFSSGAVSVANYGEKDERFHIGGFSKDGQVREEVETYSLSENGYIKEEDGDESKENNNHWADKDPFADSIKSFAALQEALWKEVQTFQELGKEPIPLQSNIDELSSSDQPRNENCGEDNSTSSGLKALILKEKVQHLEHKLEEARAALEEKEAKIQELENLKMESELEDILQRKIEAEIEHLMLTGSLSSLQLPQEPKKLHSLTEDPPESNREVILGKTCKLSIYILTQLILLVSMLWFLVLQSSPASQLVIPT